MDVYYKPYLNKGKELGKGIPFQPDGNSKCKFWLIGNNFSCSVSYSRNQRDAAKDGERGTQGLASHKPEQPTIQEKSMSLRRRSSAILVTLLVDSLGWEQKPTFLLLKQASTGRAAD